MQLNLAWGRINAVASAYGINFERYAKRGSNLSDFVPGPFHAASDGNLGEENGDG